MAKNRTVPMSCDESEHHSVEVRKIKNGFLLRKSSHGPDGYMSDEEFHAERPQIHAGLTQQDDGSVGGEALRAAIGHIKGK